ALKDAPAGRLRATLAERHRPEVGTLELVVPPWQQEGIETPEQLIPVGEKALPEFRRKMDEPFGATGLDGAEIKMGPLKTIERLTEKLATRGKHASEIGDVVRGTLLAKDVAAEAGQLLRRSPRMAADGPA